jgi:hypothetical protein
MIENVYAFIRWLHSSKCFKQFNDVPGFKTLSNHYDLIRVEIIMKASIVKTSIKYTFYNCQTHKIESGHNDASNIKMWYILSDRFLSRHPFVN